MTYFNYDPYMNYPAVQYNGTLIRGPLPDFNKPFVSFIGAAQTFGRFCHRPFPTIIGEELNIGALNLGFGGAGPEEKIFYRAVSDINRGRCCVIQVMSGRSCSNKLIRIKKGQNSRLTLTGEDMVVPDMWNMLLEINDRNLIFKVINDTMHNYIKYYRLLLSLIECPKILLYISKTQPRIHHDLDARPYDNFIWNFPHFVTASILNELSKLTYTTVKFVSTTGLPQKLEQIDKQESKRGIKMYEREGFEEMEYNNYYPSPEMHAECAEILKRVVRKYV